jgi:hypothetical protein
MLFFSNSGQQQLWFAKAGFSRAVNPGDIPFT